jgi:sorbitol/mannitol transport system permease protein
MDPKLREKLLMTALGWGAAGLIFFPIFWMMLTSFKTELEAVQTPPSLFFAPTLENYVEVQERAAYFRFAMNSVLISFGSTVLALAFAVPAAYAMAFFPGRRTKDTLLWMLST